MKADAQDSRRQCQWGLWYVTLSFSHETLVQRLWWSCGSTDLIPAAEGEFLRACLELPIPPSFGDRG